MTWSPSLGAWPTEAGTALGVWAPVAEVVEVVTERTAWPLRNLEDGTFCGTIPDIRVRDLYRYRLDGKGLYPDPASRFQPQGSTALPR